MKVENLANNQVVITDGKKKVFSSYGTTIAVVNNGKTTLDKVYWNFSATTTKYLSRFLGGEKKADIQKKIDNGTYKLSNLN
jgi:hypothetical protein